MRRLLARAWFLGLVVGALAGCGVPADSGPRVIPPDDLPAELVEPAPPPPVSTTVPVTERLSVYLVLDDRLVEVSRDTRPPPTPRLALAALLAGPTAEEAAAGIRTAIGTTSGVATGDAQGGTVEIELGPSFEAAGGSEQVLAIAQIVYTLTAVPGVDGVDFTLSGRAVEVPRGDGTLTGEALRRDAFPNLAPE
jgi:hypothetical protein